MTNTYPSFRLSTLSWYDSSGNDALQTLLRSNPVRGKRGGYVIITRCASFRREKISMNDCYETEIQINHDNLIHALH